MTTLRVAGFERSRHQLSYEFTFDRLHFAASLWYESVDFDELEARYGTATMDDVYFHIGAYEVNKLCSLRPDTLDFGPFSHLVTEDFEQTWRTIFRNVWAQWRYENDLPDEDGPDLEVRDSSAVPAPATLGPGAAVDVLAFCGGGKDSLVALRLLERVGVPYASLAYSSSIYGRAEPQHELIASLLDHCRPLTRHRQWLYDDIMDSPVVALTPEAGVRTLIAGETPASIFEAIPIALAHGYRWFCLAHERSADRGNLVWDATGEEVNHQWGKSAAAERVLNDYVRARLVTDLEMFSVLKPVHDVLIFNLLAENLDAAPAAHSCNVEKPWCRRCAKCAYVWLNYQAYLPTELVDAIFAANLFDEPANRRWYREMLGLEAHTPFECIGEVAEARLAFELCRARGQSGAAMDDYVAEIGTTDVAATLEDYLTVDRGYEIPLPAGPAILDELEAAAARARTRLRDVSR